MLITHDITKSGEITFESRKSKFKRKLRAVIFSINVKRVKELLTPEELILIEIVSSIDFENLTPEILYKFEVLYRFTIRL